MFIIKTMGKFVSIDYLENVTPQKSFKNFEGYPFSFGEYAMYITSIDQRPERK